MVKHGICRLHATDLVFFLLVNWGVQGLVNEKDGCFLDLKDASWIENVPTWTPSVFKYRSFMIFCILQCCTHWVYNKRFRPLSTPCRRKKTHQEGRMFRIHFIPSHCLHTALELAVHTSHKHCGGGRNQFVSWPLVSESSLSSASETAFLRSKVSEVHTPEN